MSPHCEASAQAWQRPELFKEASGPWAHGSHRDVTLAIPSGSSVSQLPRDSQ